jgi:hypothetical protein
MWDMIGDGLFPASEAMVTLASHCNRKRCPMPAYEDALNSAARIVVDLLRTIIWPLVIIFLFSRFGADISALLTRTRQFVVKVAGVEVTFSGAEAGPLLAAVLSEVAQAARSFTAQESRLFDKISGTSGSPTVDEITQAVFGRAFKRGDDSDEHKAFRALHRANLIRPAEGDSWQPEKHPELTTLGRLVLNESLRAGESEPFLKDGRSSSLSSWASTSRKS